ncbi:MAG: tetratricopeptide repeat protein [Acidobacteria bacterium]|nr:tetratricopeptide repeat protein [Acidobacteriota bacterium]
MNKENILFSVIGLLLGCIVGFVFANTVNQRGYEPGAQNAASKNQSLPPDHPPVPSNGVADQGEQPAAVMQQIQQARNEPNNFEAQVGAAQLYYQIRRYDEAIEFLLKANQLRPDDYQTVVMLGDANFEAEHFEAAEKWYTAALTKKPDDADVRTDLGLTFFLRQPPDIDRAVKEYRAVLEHEPKHEKALQNLTVALIKKGDAKEAQTTLSQLEAVNPNNEVISKLRSDLEGLKTK